MFKKERYPRDWRIIRQRILERAGNRCEGSPIYPSCRARNGKPHPVTGSKVVLTISHYPDPDPRNCDPSNLAARCARCHLAIDRPHHLAVQKRNREAKRLAVQPRLPLVERGEEEGRE
jgi:hypothetical protein